jgi:hypothetical protein
LYLSCRHTLPAGSWPSGFVASDDDADRVKLSLSNNELIATISGVPAETSAIGHAKEPARTANVSDRKPGATTQDESSQAPEASRAPSGH